MGIMIGMMACLGAQAVQETQLNEQPLIVRMGVMQGPSGFSTIGLVRNGGKIDDSTIVEMSTFPSPNEVIARLVNGDLDIAALPTNVAANLAAKGVPIQVTAVVGEGMLMLLTSDTTLKDLSDLAGRRITIPGAGSTPDQVTRILLEAQGYDVQKDVELDYSIASPAQVAQMLIAGKVDLAVLPEPFVTLALNTNKNVRVLVDLQSLWQEVTGSAHYPMTVVVVHKQLVEKYPDRLKSVMDAIRASVQWVNEYPEQAGVLIEEANIMKASMAVPAIARCNLVFRRAIDAKEAMETYFKVLYEFDSQSIGGKIPDASFYLDY